MAKKTKEIVLPTERRQVKEYNPRLMVLFGKPKSGKSSVMAALDDNLILDLEEGYKSLSVMSIDIKSYTDLFAVEKALKEKYDADGKFPYKYITIDNATRLEEMALPYAAKLYRATPMSGTWGYKKDSLGQVLKDTKGQPIIDKNADVRTLPNGGGYLHLRNAIKKMVNIFKPLCETLILVAHVKDKQIRVDGEEMSEMSVDLAGKTGDIICGEADAIGYIYRDGNKTMMSFEGGDNTIREARPLHLRGKRFCVIESDVDNNLTFNLTQIFK